MFIGVPVVALLSLPVLVANGAIANGLVGCADGYAKWKLDWLHSRLSRRSLKLSYKVNYHRLRHGTEPKR